MDKLDNSEYTDTGSLRISEDVLAAIAGNAAKEIKGVAGLTIRTTPENLGIFRKKEIEKSIKLEIKDGEAVIDIYVSLFSGAKIPETSEQIQARVKETIQNMTGMAVSKVNVHISGLVIKENAQE